ncbi:TIGR00730 family Rossman fold protein [Halobacillus salinus]|uniref:Cytokinin riboside 5'-monophosphate phosphoribohydrolase n=1 Tax=Halobacillus salinus TaxID=192814 RepID=A0A4Z0GXD8_9BACI|nr:TIGR00730 family Rossman fold protein [Halobacillus salinus]TGB01234.1 TIGR00730 family Rossman fold protein [Halobacillus salinus]
MKRICVFAGSSKGNNEAFAEQTKALGQAFVDQGLSLVYGGAQSGLMGVLADEILDRGGQVTGVMPTHLFEKEVAHTGLTELIQVASMHERKAKMSELADGYIALPGGFGTFEELFEVISWAQIGLHTKPLALFNIEEYYSPLIRLVEHAIEAGFVPENNKEMILQADHPSTLLQKMNNFTD